MEPVRANGGFGMAVSPVSCMVGCSAAAAVADGKAGGRLAAPERRGFVDVSGTQQSSILAGTAVGHKSCRQSVAVA